MIVVLCFVILLQFMMIVMLLFTRDTKTTDPQSKTIEELKVPKNQDLDFDSIDLDAFDFVVIQGWERITTFDGKIIISKFKGEIDLNHKDWNNHKIDYIKCINDTEPLRCEGLGIKSNKELIQYINNINAEYKLHPIKRR